MENLFKKELSIVKNFDEKADVVLHCGASLEFLRTVPDKAISLIISSPPYNIGKEYEKKIAIEEYLTKQKPVMFEQTFKNIDDILHKDAGCSSELDFVEQTSWVLFLKYLDDFEKDKKTAEEFQVL